VAFFNQRKERTMAQKRSSSGSRHGSSSSSRQHAQQSESKQMGQSGTGRRQQGTLHPPRQSGGASGVKHQQAAQDTGRHDESAMSRQGSHQRGEDVMSDEDIERAGLTRESGLDDDSENESR
jgi:hypothetical protein